MKYIINRIFILVILFGFLFLNNCYSQTDIYTNGVFVKNGITEQVDNKVFSFVTTNKTKNLHFSNGLVIKINTNTDFSINSFFQEVKELNSPIPHKSKFGSSNFASTIMNGSLIAVYSGGDSNSSCVISTPLTDIELYKGVFYFKVTNNRVLVFVLDGSLKSYGDKNKENVVTSGYAVVATPNDIGVLEDKVSLGAEKVKQEVINKLMEESKYIIKVKDNILFSTINNKVVGIVIN